MKIESYLVSLEKIINDRLKEIIKGDTLYQKYIRIVLAGGKKLRPKLCILCCQSLTDDKRAFNFALDSGLSIELGHSASLVQDDIIDLDNFRRGGPTLLRKIGIAKTILTIDLMLSKAIVKSIDGGPEIVKILARVWENLSKGAIKEFEKNDLSFKDYLKIIKLKTANLFAASCQAGAVCANSNKGTQKLFSDYGLNLGMAFQLADDIVDKKNQRYNRISFKKEMKKHIKLAKEKIEKLNSINNFRKGYKNLLIGFPDFAVKSILKEKNAK